MPNHSPQFYAKTWIFRGGSIILGGFTAFGLVMGPLFLTGAMKRPDGTPARDAGIGITAVTLVFMLPAFVVAAFNLRVRRHPLIRICREGVKAHLIGRTSIDGIPLVPAAVRLWWGFVTTQSFRNRALRALWPDVRGAQVSGLPAMRVLSIDGTFREIPDGILVVTEPVTFRIVFQQADFKKPLQDVADAIAFYHSNPLIHGQLPTWSQRE